MKPITLFHLYPDVLNLYGDRGNLICLQKRLEWAGYPSQIVSLPLGQSFRPDRADFIFMGGGSDREQALVAQELRRQKTALWEQIENGLPMLCVCGSYQFLGDYYETPSGERYEGLCFFGFHTVAQTDRLIGNIILEANLDGASTQLIGFENHGGRTHFHDVSIKPLGQVIHGFGNNCEDKSEGLHYQNLIGTYLHGPILPKNPALADHFLHHIMRRRDLDYRSASDDTIEHYAHRQAQRRALGLKQIG